MREKELIIFRGFEDGGLLRDMTWLMENYENEYYNEEDRAALLYECIHRLIEMGGSYGFYGNLWHCYLTNLLVGNENSYSMMCEIRGEIKGTVNQAVLHDIRIFREFFDYDFAPMAERLHAPEIRWVLDYESDGQKSRIYTGEICRRICELARRLAESGTPEHMKAILTRFYGDYGTGKFGLHKAFRIVHDEAGVRVEPIRNIAHVRLSDLVGYEIAKKKLTDNTEAFVEGRRANNCLLYGDAGTGKSSSIKGIVNEYYDRGLRIIEIYKHQFRDLNEVISQIKYRNYKFIIYMDDLSFEEFETEYKYLKAVIEGGLEKKPDNVLIYATSNRRHLVRERFSDRQEREDDLHKGDTVQEKVSLSERFGERIYFGAPDKKEFQQIVRTLAQRAGIDMPEDQLLAEANKWELSHGGLSGRTAQQFIDYLLGTGCARFGFVSAAPNSQTAERQGDYDENICGH
ncbi:MAG: ATP-binding protein [Lachnospiraceae bacterium]|nr:ATP-binding protein [Lachnospiraceae bacterium]